MTDDDLDAMLAAGPRPRRPAGNECATGWALKQLDPGTADKVRTAIDYGVPGEDIADALRRRGLDVTRMSVDRHARGGCTRCADKGTA